MVFLAIRLLYLGIRIVKRLYARRSVSDKPFTTAPIIGINVSVFEL